MIVVLSTYSPREDGIATFTEDLAESMQKISANQMQIRVAAINPSSLQSLKYPNVVHWQINPDSTTDYCNLASSLNRNQNINWVIIQHEYGIFGGNAGNHLLPFLRTITKPLLITLHTILADIPLELKIIQDELMERAKAIVVLTERSANILKSQYPLFASKIFVISHGIHPVAFCYPDECKKTLKLQKHIVLSTFGLLSRGKGIEYVIRSLPAVKKQFPRLLYLILGKTHPNILLEEGESYRHELMGLVISLKLQDNVRFYNSFMTLQDILDILKATDIYISTSINPNQAVSGTLSYALGTGRATISTRFSQSEDFVTPDVGNLVPPCDPDSFSFAIITLLNDRILLNNKHYNAYIKTRDMIWPNIGYNYLNTMFNFSGESISNLFFATPPKLDHLINMTDNMGMFQFSDHKKPDHVFGYTLDDNSRALIVMNLLNNNGNSAKKTINKLSKTYLSFIELCQLSDGRFINYIDIEKKLTSLNYQEELESSYSRAMWALAYTLESKTLSLEQLKKAQILWDNSSVHLPTLLHPHAISILLKALYFKNQTDLISIYADKLVSLFDNHSTKEWYWFEDCITYDNGSFIEGLLLAYRKLNKKDYLRVAIKALDFLIDNCYWSGIHVPIGQNGWFNKGSNRAVFDQQPEEPCSMMLALIQAYQVTHSERYLTLLNKTFSWFLGNNLLGLPLYDPDDGSCSDGLTPNGINLNYGAESQLAYLFARLSYETLLKL